MRLSSTAGGDPELWALNGPELVLLRLYWVSGVKMVVEDEDNSVLGPHYWC